MHFGNVKVRGNFCAGGLILFNSIKIPGKKIIKRQTVRLSGVLRSFGISTIRTFLLKAQKVS